MFTAVCRTDIKSLHPIKLIWWNAACCRRTSSLLIPLASPPYFLSSFLAQNQNKCVCLQHIRGNVETETKELTQKKKNFSTIKNRTMATSTAQVGNLSITTQVLPAGENNVSGLSSAPTWTQVLAQKKKRPYKSLGALIILIGVLQLCIGASMYVSESDHPSLLSRSGAPCWGGVAFITMGIITVVFARDDGIVKIKICLTANLINVALAAIGMILYAVQLYKDSQACWLITSDSGYNHCIPGNYNTTRDDGHHEYSFYWTYEDYIYSLRVSLISLLLFYVVVGFAISVSILLLRWKSFKETRYTLLGN